MAPRRRWREARLDLAEPLLDAEMDKCDLLPCKALLPPPQDFWLAVARARGVEEARVEVERVLNKKKDRFHP